MWCVQVYGLNSSVDYSNVKTHDTREGNVTTRREIQAKNIHFLGFWKLERGDIKEGDIMEVRVYM